MKLTHMCVTRLQGEASRHILQLQILWKSPRSLVDTFTGTVSLFPSPPPDTGYMLASSSPSVMSDRKHNSLCLPQFLWGTQLQKYFYCGPAAAKQPRHKLSRSIVRNDWNNHKRALNTKPGTPLLSLKYELILSLSIRIFNVCSITLH